MVKATELAKKIRHALKAESEKLYQPWIPKSHRGHPCSIDGCPNPAYAGGLCNSHYLRRRRGADMLAPLQNRKSRQLCVDCGNPVSGKGGWSLCQSHYRMRRRKVIRETAISEMGGCCQHCGGIFPTPVYDFHHRNENEKLFAPSNSYENLSIDVLAEEIAKCDLLCANCHRIEHYGRIPEFIGGDPPP